MEEVFEEDQEMLILVTELTVRYYCAKFITKFDCNEYFKHNHDLLKEISLLEGVKYEGILLYPGMQSQSV